MTASKFTELIDTPINTTYSDRNRRPIRLRRFQSNVDSFAIFAYKVKATTFHLDQGTHISWWINGHD
ncbi:hypothetical protein LTS18_000126 [Coniosporium uncinatum]|uniref:Uncharacterized protein n=1 Tax=Coniosporium uncinatum TaxID=93489 RepID=A0ACC3D8G0_9PEZI|nr:hypothetical protein LTS18_000126 [Coniosporium uncinatum]